MAKQKVYKAGDIFTVPLGNTILGYGRVLRFLGDIVLIEVFDLEHFEKEKKLQSVYTACCWDDEIQKKRWKIIDHQLRDSSHVIPDFYGTEALTDQPYKIIGETVLTGENAEDEVRVPISKNEMEGMEQYGIMEPEGAVHEYIERIKKKKDMKFGRWGLGFFNNDSGCECQILFNKWVEKGYKVEGALEKVMDEYRPIINNQNHEYYVDVILAIAVLQKEYRLLSMDIKTKVHDVIDRKLGLETWAHSPKEMKERETYLTNFKMFLEW